jgi:heat-inducible transcriptional repressor
LEKAVNILNERLAGVPLEELNGKIYKEVALLLRQHIHNYDFMMQTITESLKMPVNDKLFFGGKTNMLSQPEFHDISKIKSLLTMIDQEEWIYNFIRKNSAGLNIKIGRENNNSAMENCSLITATYAVGAEKYGTIAILGPTRMEYSRVISLLQLFSRDLTEVLSKLYQNK